MQLLFLQLARNLSRFAALFVVFLLLQVNGRAQTTSSDNTFNPADTGVGDGANSAVRSVIVQPDGKVLIGGNFTSYNGATVNRICRLNSDGTKDNTFDSGTGANSDIYAMALQPDGKVLIAGNFTTYNGISIARIARLNSDGAIDNTFTPGTGANGAVRCIALQSDGKVYIGGAFTTVNGQTNNGIARLKANGSVDAHFNNAGNGTVNGSGSGIVYAMVLKDNKLIIGGTFQKFNNTAINRIAVLDTAGTLSVGFNPGTGANSDVQALALQPDGKIIVGGNFTNYNGATINRIVRLEANGTRDLAFTPGTGANGAVATILLQPDGKILIGGSFTSFSSVSKSRFTRLNDSGSLDNTFDNQGANTSLAALALQPDGKILIAGLFSAVNGIPKGGIVRLNDGGTLDEDFNKPTGADGVVRAIVLQPDNKIIAGGSFIYFNGVDRNRIVRLDADGTVDLSFNPGTGADGDIQALALQPDGKIIVGGSFTSFNGISRNRLVRLNSDGTVDLGFDPGTGANSDIQALAVLPDGRIVIGGNFTYYNLHAINRIALLEPDGTLATSFDPGTGADGTVSVITLQPDGSILLAGSFTNFNDFPISRIARVTQDGMLDGAFDPGSGLNNTVLAMTLQHDGSILVAGEFTNCGGVPRNRIARLYSNGAIDDAFDPGSGANGDIQALVVYPDSRIMIGGNFTSFNGTLINRIAMLDNYGALYSLFNPGAGMNNAVSTMALQPDGKILIGGSLTSYNLTARNRIARLNTENSALPVNWLYFKGMALEAANQLSWATAMEKNTSYFVVERSLDGRNFEAISQVQAAGNSSQKNEYAFLDYNATVLNGKTAYYRLKQMDLDGKSEYSPIVIIRRKSRETTVAVYPNPFVNTFTVAFLPPATNTNANLELTTLEGKTVFRQEEKVSAATRTMALRGLPELPSGVYLLRVRINESLTVLKVVKQ